TGSRYASPGAPESRVGGGAGPRGLARGVSRRGGLFAAPRVTAGPAGRSAMDVEHMVLDPVDLGAEREHQASMLRRRDIGHYALEEAIARGLDDADLQPADLPVVRIPDRGTVGPLDVQTGLRVAGEEAVAAAAVDAFEGTEPERRPGCRHQGEMDGARGPRWGDAACRFRLGVVDHDTRGRGESQRALRAACRAHAEPGRPAEVDPRRRLH